MDIKGKNMPEKRSKLKISVFLKLLTTKVEKLCYGKIWFLHFRN